MVNSSGQIEKTCWPLEGLRDELQPVLPEIQELRLSIPPFDNPYSCLVAKQNGIPAPALSLRRIGALSYERTSYVCDGMRLSVDSHFGPPIVSPDYEILECKAYGENQIIDTISSTEGVLSISESKFAMLTRWQERR